MEKQQMAYDNEEWVRDLFTNLFGIKPLKIIAFYQVDEIPPGTGFIDYSQNNSNVVMARVLSLVNAGNDLTTLNFITGSPLIYSKAFNPPAINTIQMVRTPINIGSGLNQMINMPYLIFDSIFFGNQSVSTDMVLIQGFKIIYQ